MRPASIRYCYRFYKPVVEVNLYSPPLIHISGVVSTVDLNHNLKLATRQDEPANDNLSRGGGQNQCWPVLTFQENLRSQFQPVFFNWLEHSIWFHTQFFTFQDALVSSSFPQKENPK